MSKYSNIIRHDKPINYFKFDESGTSIILDEIAGVYFEDDSNELTLNQPSAISNEPSNYSIKWNGSQSLVGSIDTSKFNDSFTIEFYIKPAFLNINFGNGYSLSILESGDIIIPESTSWVQRGDILQSSVVGDYASFGESCSVSNDGEILVVGASTSSGKGIVITYDRDGDTWVQRGTPLQYSIGASAGYFGESCSLSGDGEILVVGAPRYDSSGLDGNGVMFTFDRSGDTWIQRGNFLECIAPINFSQFGKSCGLSDDGNILVVGIKSHVTSNGAIFTYDRSGDIWIIRGDILRSPTTNTDTYDVFGHSSSLSNDGNILAVGSSGKSKVYLFDRDGVDWVYRSVINGYTSHLINSFGTSCDLSGDGNILMVGDIDHENGEIYNRNYGAVYTYDNIGTSWVQRGSYIFAPDKTINDFFGSGGCLSNDGHSLIVGANLHETTGIDTGAVYTYDLDVLGAVIPKDNFSQLTLSNSNGNLDIYSNGSLIKSTPFSKTFNNTSNLIISGSSTIDEFAIYDRLLSKYEIESHYNNAMQFNPIETSILDSNPEFYYPMNSKYSKIGYGILKDYNNPVISTNGIFGDSTLYNGVDQYSVIEDVLKDEYDEDFRDVVLLLHMDGDDNSNTFTDSSIYQNEVNAVLDAKIKTDIFKFNGSSAKFDGVGDYLSIPFTPSLSLRGDFTIEFNLYRTGDLQVGTRYFTSIKLNSYGIIIYSPGLTESNILKLYMSSDGSTNFDIASSISITSSIELNTWYHITLVRYFDNIRVYVNGVAEIDISSPLRHYYYSNELTIGGASNQSINGYIDEFRISTIARYTTNFDIPSNQFKELNIKSAEILPDIDPYYKNVSFLQNQNELLDDSFSNIKLTPFGNPQMSDSIFKFNKSIQFNGVGDYVDISENNIKFNQNDFTVEFWFNKSVTPLANERLIAPSGGTNIAGGFQIWINNSTNYGSVIGAISLAYPSGTSNTVKSNTSIVDGLWHHLAITRTSGVSSLYLDGVLNDSKADTFVYVDLGWIGGRTDLAAGTFFNGYLEGLRITENVARYTSDFTPPNKPHYSLHQKEYELIQNPYDEFESSVVLHLELEGENNSSTFVDSSNSNHQINPINGAKITTSDFKIGKSSILFDGVDDYLSIPASSDFTFGVGDFTIECYIKGITLSSRVVTNRLIQQGLGGTFSINLSNTSIGITEVVVGEPGLSALYDFNPSNWYHIAITRLSGVCNIFVNGTLLKSGTVSIDFSSSSQALIVGASVNETYVNGYVDNLIITKGVCRYSSHFTPTFSFNIKQSKNELSYLNKPIDENFKDTKLLLKANEPLNSSTLIDSSNSNHTLTNNGTPVIGTIDNEQGVHFQIGDTWIQRGLILQASDLADDDIFGSCCSLSGDGNIMVVATDSHETSGQNTGVVYTYDRSGDSWVQRGAILQASDITNYDSYGSSCSISNDGNTLVVGAYRHETTGINTGAVYTYDRSGDSWVQRGAILQASDIADYDYFGQTCSLSGDDNTLVVGATAHDTTGINTGAVYTYDRSGDTWIQRGTILQASDLADNDIFGSSCGLSSDGNIMVVGARLHETTGINTGAVYTYDRSGDSWVQRGAILQASDLADGDRFGGSCSLSDNGNIMVVGARLHETTGIDTGAVYTYDRSGDTWIQRGTILQASDLADEDYFSSSCGLSSDGNIMVVGARSHETTGINTGAMYTYDMSGASISLPTNSDWALGSTDFTVEGFINTKYNSRNQSLFGTMETSPALFQLNIENKPEVYDGTSYFTCSIPVSTNTWTHVAFSRYNGTLKIFVDGVAGYTGTLSKSFNQESNMYIGGQLQDRFFIGYIDEFRVTNGTARYIEDFTVPNRNTPIISNGFNINDSTIECWFNVSSVNGNSYNTIFSKGSELEQSLIIQDSTFTTSGEIKYKYSDDTIIINTSLSLNSWIHIVITLAVNSIKMYLNGELVNHTTEQYIPNSNNFYIGSDPDLTYPSNVYVNGFTQYNRELNEVEILKRYNLYENIIDPNLIDYYQKIKDLGAKRYFKLDDKNENIREEVEGNYYNMSNSEYKLQQESRLLADYQNKSIDFINTNLQFNPIQLTSATVSIKINLKSYPASNYVFIQGASLSFAYISTSDNTLRIYNGASGGFVSSGLVLQLNTEYSFTIAVSSSVITWFLNGIQFASNSFSSGITEISKLSGLDTSYDEFIIFDRILSNTEILELHQAGQSKYYTHDSYTRLISNSNVKHYYKLNDGNTNIIDSINGYNGVIAGNFYSIEAPSLLKSEITDGSVSMTDAKITFDNTITLSGDISISFLLSLNSNASGNIIYQTNKGGIVVENGILSYNNGIHTVELYTPKLNEVYYYTLVLDRVNNIVVLYVNSKLTRLISNNVLLDGFDSIGSDNFNISIDEISIHDFKLSEKDIYQLYSKTTYDVENSIGYRIIGITQIVGSSASVDLRIYNHETGNLLNQIKSDTGGYYEFNGLSEGVKYDVIVWDNDDTLVCQHVQMGLIPEPYEY